MTKKLLGKTDEQIEDLVAALVSGDGNVGWNYDDANGELQIDASSLTSDVQSAKSISIDNTDNLLSVQEALSETRFELGLTKLDYDDGLFDTFVNGDSVTLGSPTPATSLEDEGFADLVESYSINTNLLYISEPLNSQVLNIDFNNDGSKLYITYYDSDIGESAIKSADLSTPYDLTTASATGAELALRDQNSGMEFNDDGTKLYNGVGSNTEIQSYTLSTAFDLSTASEHQTFDVSGEMGSVYDFTFEEGGSRLFVVDGGSVYQYTLSTAYDITTSSFKNSYDVNGNTPYGADGIAFDDDGSKMFLTNDNTDIRYFTLSTNYDITTATLGDGRIDPAGGVNREILFYKNGTRVLTVDNYDTVYVYDSLFVNEPAPTYGVDGYMQVKDTYNIDSISYTGESLNLSDVSSPAGAAFNDDGTKFYVVNNGSTARIHSYELSTPFDITTGTYITSTNVNTNTDTIRGIKFNDTGTKLYVVSDANGRIDIFELSTAYDISMVMYQGEYNVGQSGSLTDLAFDDDGTTLFVLSDSTDAIYAHDLDVAYDTATAQYNGRELDISNNSPGGRSLTFNDTGTELFVGDQYAHIQKYTLSKPYRIQSAEHELETTVADDEADMADGLTFDNVGSELYVIDPTTQAGYVYNSTNGESPAVFTEFTSLGFTPETVVVSDEREEGLTMTYIIEDGADNSIHVEDSEVGTAVDVSALTDGDIQFTAVIDGQDTAKLDSFAAYFN